MTYQATEDCMVQLNVKIPASVDLRLKKKAVLNQRKKKGEVLLALRAWLENE